MSLAQNSHTISVSSGGNLEIIVTQESSNWPDNTSQVTVTGRIGNVGSGGSTSSSKNILCDIGGEASFTWPHFGFALAPGCLLYTSDAADDLLCVDLGGRRIIKK